MSATMTLHGDDKFKKQVDDLVRKLGRKGALKVVRKGANIIKRSIRSIIPVGPTGNLKRSIQSKTLRGLPAAVVVRTNFKRGPHIHLNTLGTSARFRDEVYSNITKTLIPVSGRRGYTGVMKANDFIHKAASNGARQATQAIKSELERLLTS